MKKLMSLWLVLSLSSAAWATPYEFNGVWVDVDAWVGSGANETILVIDWNRLDHGADTISESHAFGYRWDGQATQRQMLWAFDAADIFTLTTSYGDAVVSNIIYNDGAETHFQIELDSWNTGSTTNPYARWGTWGDTEWDFDWTGIDQGLLGDGQFEGLNACIYKPKTVVPVGADITYQLNIPFVPEPATLSLLACGAIGLGKRRMRSA